MREIVVIGLGDGLEPIQNEFITQITNQQTQDESKRSVFFAAQPRQLLYSTSTHPHLNLKEHVEDSSYIIMDEIRTLLENCDSPQGFIIYNNNSDFFGYAIAETLLHKIKYDSPKKNIFQFSILPMLDHSFGIYNSTNIISSLSTTAEIADMAVAVQISSIFEAFNRKKHQHSSISTTTIKKYIGDLMTSLTIPLRLTCTVPNTFNTLPKLCTSLLPYPDQPFLLTSSTSNFKAALLGNPSAPPTRIPTCPELRQATVAPYNFAQSCDPRHGRYLTSLEIFQGSHIGQREVLEQMFNIGSRNSSYYVEWIPNNTKYVLHSSPPPGQYSAASIGLSTSFQYSLQSILKEGGVEGGEEVERIRELIDRYQWMQNATADDDEEEVGT